MVEAACGLRPGHDGHDAAGRVDHRQIVEQGIRETGHARTGTAVRQVAGGFRTAGATVADDDFLGHPALTSVGLDQMHAIEQHAGTPTPLTTTLAEFLQHLVVRILARSNPLHRWLKRATGP
jgi:hypothetical protein